MRLFIKYLFFGTLLVYSIGCSDSSGIERELTIRSIFAGAQELDLSQSSYDDTPIDLSLDILFNAAVDIGTAQNNIQLSSDASRLDINLSFSNENRQVRVRPKGSLPFNSSILLTITDELKGADGQSFKGRVFQFNTVNGELKVIKMTVDGQDYNLFDRLIDVSVNPVTVIDFSLPVDISTIESHFSIKGDSEVQFQVQSSNNDTRIEITPSSSLEPWTEYTLELGDGITGAHGEVFEKIEQVFFTRIDEEQKFPTISDEELLTLVQSQTFKYFWDFGHANSGLARERNRSGSTVTSGGSGFGLMAMIVGVERGFISRQDAIERWEKIFNFLEDADRFHGAWSHWIDGDTGKVRPFSQRDNGGDLVETAFLVQGMLTVRQYLDESVPRESALIDQINRLWEEVEWNWYTQGGQDVLTWHWSPDMEWAINLKIRGHNETQIIYILAASSPTHPIAPEVYHLGYARSGNMVNGSSHYGYELPLGRNMGGPLFFAHYSYLGMDPRNLEDQYANYWEQNVNHTLINRSYCIENPKNHVGYSEDCWGLTASDNHEGYSAHSPSNDKGVITPTAAISSIPYTPEESMDAIRHFYYILGDKLWGEYGFYDAFNPTEGWYASSYIAIDQGPIICMIENYRTGLLWDLFMSSPEIQQGLNALGFTY